MLQVTDLTDDERRLLDASAQGVVLDLRPRRGALAPVRKPPIRGSVLVWLLTEDLPEGVAVPLAVRVRGAEITGNLNLGGRVLRCALDLRDCELGGRVSLALAEAPSVSFRGSTLHKGLSARHVRVTHALNLSDNFTAKAQVCLRKAHLGEANFSAARLFNPDGIALHADGAAIASNLPCDKGFVAHGQVRLLGAEINGAISFRGAHLIDPGGYALTADRVNVTGDLFCRSGFFAHGEVRLPGAHIGGQADFSDAYLLNPGGNALTADDASIAGSMFFEEFVARGGPVRLPGAKIGGQVDFTGARLLNSGGNALSADHVTITGSLFCRSGFVACGELRLLGACIGGQVDFSSAKLCNPNADALNLDGATVSNELFCRNGFTSDGRLSVAFAHIGRFELSDAIIRGDGHYALDLEQAMVDTTLRLRCKSIDNGIIDGNGASVGHLDDDPASWPVGSIFAGLSYRSICDRGNDFSADRRDWARRHLRGYAPQVYDQLASTYRAAGHGEGARKVLIAKQSARRSQPLPDQTRLHRVLRPPRRAVRAGWSAILRWTIGYGYAPWRSLGWLVPLYVAGWLGIFRRVGPADLTALHAGAVFHPALYTLDLLVPVVSLKQRDAWAVHGGFELWAAGFTIIGWLAATVIAAGLAGLFKRD